MRLHLFLFYPLAFALVLFQFSLDFANSCSSRPSLSRRGRRPLYFKQRVPDVDEFSLGASGRPQGKITRNSSKFNKLVACYNTDIVFKDEERTGADRLMSKRCREKLRNLATKVKQKWKGVKLRVTEAWDEDGQHSLDSLHYEGRAVDISTSDKDPKKLPDLGSLAVDAGFDWVYYDRRSSIHASVRSDDDRKDSWGSCFHSEALVTIENGERIAIKDLKTGQRVQSMDETGRLLYSEVLIFLDYKPWLSKVPFTIIETDVANLALTRNHLIFVMKRNSSTIYDASAKLAQFVTPGDYVLVNSKGKLHPSRVMSVRIEHKLGAVAPLTAQGTIIVDGVVASCYSEVTSHTISHLAFSPLRGLRYWLPSVFSWLHEGITPAGVHWFPRFLISLNQIVRIAEFA
ncbi:predicted protein [Nematostella vectensis]|uniref:Hedgehog protein n=1 Tax=Nematostella vectensis TaxID=45351 RepID=A7RY14_NEMVE|nr:indian hedgehog protein [Nematostella vectensis]ABX89897.1 hedgehog1 [Nematostella vectensis]EDO43615.1 predicted protein [Nematostella vectensis]|eukprot:XP_001635678.1 predicted protein [Nematostella vectensis]